jgi:hypothetical protein
LRPIKKKPQKPLDIILDSEDHSIDSTKGPLLQKSTPVNTTKEIILSQEVVSESEMELDTPEKRTKVLKSKEQSTLPVQSIETVSNPVQIPETNPQLPSETAQNPSETSPITTVMVIDNIGSAHNEVDCEVCGQPGANVKCLAPDCKSYIHFKCSVFESKNLCSLDCKKIYLNE